jgi:NAD-dependent dihydropyrimidine dehydrogenase PreA subunit
MAAVYHAGTVLPTAKWELMSAVMHKRRKYRSFFLCRLRVCSAVCPRGVLKLENDTAGRINSEILLGNDFKLMDLITNK